MKIARIVKSNSHIDYVGRVIDRLDADNPPGADDYGFAQFVLIPMDDGAQIAGVIYDSILVNPDYANYGPRLSSKSELTAYSPDFLNEQGMLVGILLLGEFDKSGKPSHGIPHRIIPPGQDVEKMSDEKFKKFHESDSGGVDIHYYSQLIAHAGTLAAQLMETIIRRLEETANGEEKKRLNVLKQTLSWQRNIGGMRL